MLPPTSGNPTLESAIRTVFLAGSAGGGGDGEWLSPEGGRGRGRGGFRRDCWMGWPRLDSNWEGIFSDNGLWNTKSVFVQKKQQWLKSKPLTLNLEKKDKEESAITWRLAFFGGRGGGGSSAFAPPGLGGGWFMVPASNWLTWSKQAGAGGMKGSGWLPDFFKASLISWSSSSSSSRSGSAWTSSAQPWKDLKMERKYRKLLHWFTKPHPSANFLFCSSKNEKSNQDYWLL